MPFLNYNGVICTDDELLYNGRNRALRYGEGLIETMLWQGEGIRLYELHVQRLQQSLALLGFPPFTGAQLQQEIRKMIAANQKSGTGMVRAQFSREEEQGDLKFMIELIMLDPLLQQWPAKGLTLGVTQQIRKSADPIAHLKTTSRLPYLLAKKEAQEKGWDDSLLLNASGRVSESTISNIFLIRDNKIHTPPLNDGCIAGVMRRHLLEQGTIAGMPVSELAFDEAYLAGAEEIFLTNAIRGIQPVHLFNHKTYERTLSRKIFDAISRL